MPPRLLWNSSTISHDQDLSHGFPLYLCSGPVYTCLFFSWRSICAKIALLCFQRFAGKTHSSQPKSLVVKLGIGNSWLTLGRWLWFHLVALVAFLHTFFSMFPPWTREMRTACTGVLNEVSFVPYFSWKSLFWMQLGCRSWLVISALHLVRGLVGISRSIILFLISSWWNTAETHFSPQMHGDFVLSREMRLNVTQPLHCPLQIFCSPLC